MRYKTEPPAPIPESSDGMLGGPKKKVEVEDEDNFTIQVWEEQGGRFLGHCLKTSLGSIVPDAWREAIKKYPGRYLAQTNGPYLMDDLVAPTGTADHRGWIEGGSVRLNDLPQWYGLVAECDCGNIAHVDRYDAKVLKFKLFSLTDIAGKLSCKECKKAGRPKPRIELGLVKLPR